MNELIVQETNTGIIKSEIANEVKEITLGIKTFEKRLDEIKSSLLEEMTLKDIIKIENEIEGVAVNRIAETDVEYFDKNYLKEKYPDIYDECISMKHKKAYLTIKVG